MPFKERTLRPAVYDTNHGHWAILQDVRALLKAHSSGYKRPMEIVYDLGCTRAGARLALMYWRDLKYVGHRETDGRWFYDTTEPWRRAF